jgi:hypothetical protein
MSRKETKTLQERIHFIPVNGTYTCTRDTTFVPEHINNQHDCQGGRRTVHTARTICITWRAAFPEWSVQMPRWSVVGQLHSVVFVGAQVTWRTPTRKRLEASSPGNSRAMGWAHQGLISDCCMCRLKTPALWEPITVVLLCSNSWKFRIPYDALFLLLRCYRHVCLSCASAATRPNRV